jgi:hypothetical protein
MAPSGGGETSLLNSMTRRLHSALQTKYCSSGEVLFNGCVATDSVIRSICSYVPQDDEGLLPFLTVRETLRFAACLRLPSWMSKSEKMRRAESILLRLGLKDCADTIVGSDHPNSPPGTLGFVPSVWHCPLTGKKRRCCLLWPSVRNASSFRFCRFQVPRNDQSF